MHDDIWSNHAISLLTWVYRNPDAPQSYRLLEKFTGVPKSTIWELINWDASLKPGICNPLDAWASMLGFRVYYIHAEGCLIQVFKDCGSYVQY